MLTTKPGHPDADPVIVNYQADLEARDSFCPVTLNWVKLSF